jgi:hypothetical protein
VDDSVSSRIVTETLTTSVTMDSIGGDIIAQVVFLYGQTRVDPFSPPKERQENLLLLRDTAAERNVLDLLGRHGFKVRTGEAYLSGNDAIFNFLQDGVPLLQSCAEVYCSESLLRMRPRRSRPKGKLRMSGTGDLLQFELLLEGVDPNEYNGVLQALRDEGLPAADPYRKIRAFSGEVSLHNAPADHIVRHLMLRTEGMSDEMTRRYLTVCLSIADLLTAQ